MSGCNIKFSYYDRLYRFKDKNPLPQWNPYADGVLGKEVELKRDTNSCTVITLACVTGNTYAQCYDYMKKYGRRHREGMMQSEIRNALEGMKKFKAIKGPYSRDNKITLNQFLKKHPKGKYYLCHRGHAFAVIDGVVYDHANAKRRQVNLAYRIYDKSELEEMRNARR